LALARAGTACAAVDDDAPSPVSGASAPSWSDWSTAWQALRLSSMSSSVEPREGVLHADSSLQRSIEPPMRLRTLEAREATAGIHPTSGPGPRLERAASRVEALKLALRRLAAAAGTCSRRARRRPHPPWTPRGGRGRSGSLGLDRPGPVARRRASEPHRRRVHRRARPETRPARGFRTRRHPR
jgi:hypothetical protein